MIKKVLILSFVFCGCNVMKEKPTSDCDLTLKYISRIWKANSIQCDDTKLIVGEQILKLVEEDKCLIGQPLSKVIEYFGKPLRYDGSSAQYTTITDDPLKKKNYVQYLSALFFQFNKDSIITGIQAAYETSEP